MLKTKVMSKPSYAHLVEHYASLEIDIKGVET